MMTSEEIINIFREIERKSKPAPPKPASTVAQERWAEKPTEVAIRDAAALNKDVAERLRREREWAHAEARRAKYQAVLDAHWQSMLDAQEESNEHSAWWEDFGKDLTLETITRSHVSSANGGDDARTPHRS